MNRINTDLSTYKAAALERDSQYIYNMGAEELLFEAVNKYFMESDDEDDIDDEINSSITLADKANEDREDQIMQIVNATDDITFDEMVGCDDIKDVDNEILFELASYEELERMGFEVTLEASRTFTAFEIKRDVKLKYKVCMKKARKSIKNKDFKGAAKQLKSAKSIINEAIREIKKTKGVSIPENLADTLMGFILNNVIHMLKSTFLFLTVFNISHTVLSFGKIDLSDEAADVPKFLKMLGVSAGEGIDFAAMDIVVVTQLVHNIYKIAQDIVGIMNAFIDMVRNRSLTITIFNTYANRIVSELNILGKKLDILIAILMKMEQAKNKAKKSSKKLNKAHNKSIIKESENIDDFDEPVILNY